MSSNFDSRLIKENYITFSPSPDYGRFKLGSFKKCITGDVFPSSSLVLSSSEKKYLIHIHKYDQISIDSTYRYEVIGHFAHKDGTTFTVTLDSFKGKTIAEVESFFERIWEQLGCGYLK